MLDCFTTIRVLLPQIVPTMPKKRRSFWKGRKQVTKFKLTYTHTNFTIGEKGNWVGWLYCIFIVDVIHTQNEKKARVYV